MHEPEPGRVALTSALCGAFRDDVEMLCQAIEDEHLPLELYETRRTVERQGWMFRHAMSSKTDLDSPHPWGLAADFALMLEHPWWAIRRDGRPEGHMPIFDDGVVVVDGACAIVRPAVFQVWHRLGTIAQGIGLTWGGRNGGLWASPRPQDYFGTEVNHVQARRWRDLKTAPPPKA